MMGSVVWLPLWLALRGPGFPAAALVPPTPALLRPISRVITKEKEVAITFDACATMKGRYGFDQAIFDILERDRVPATIFVSGRWVDTHAGAMEELIHDPLIEFGDHTYDHPHMTRLPAARVDREIDETEASLGRYGRHGVAFRPPFGDFDQRVMALVRARHLPTVTWDVVSGDPSKKVTTDGMIHAVLAGARSGSIIIFHINGRGWKTHEALPTILQGLRARGFRFVTLSTLMHGTPPEGLAPLASRSAVSTAAGKARPPVEKARPPVEKSTPPAL